MATWKDTVRLATTDHIRNLARVSEIDGTPVKAGYRILVKDQENPVDNGIYDASNTAAHDQFRLARSTDMHERLSSPDTSEATVRVSDGKEHAGTQWCLRAPEPGTITVGTTRLLWTQENRNYSVESIAALKKLVTAPIGSTASVAGYKAAGDNGGGDFAFIGAEPRYTITQATLRSVAISNAVASPSGVTFTTSGAHGFADGQSVYLSDVGNATGARIIESGASNQFVVKGITDASTSTGTPRASCVYVETKDVHGRPPGAQRVAICGVVRSTDPALPDPSPPDLNTICDVSAVFNDKTLTLPVPLPVPVPTRWRYKCGQKAVVGDDALLVTATDASGNSGGLWQRTISTSFNVAWWGALGDPGERIDDSPAINAAINAAKRFRDYTVAKRRTAATTVQMGPGVYWCTSKILIDGSVSLEGAAPGFGSGASMLMFNVDVGDGDALVDIVGTAIDGSGTTGNGARIRNLQIVQDPDNFPTSPNQLFRTVGIRVRASAVTIEDTFVHHIRGDGIVFDGSSYNADLWCLKGQVTVQGCSGTGVLTVGDRANAGAQTGVLNVDSCDEWGLHDHARHGNSWSAIHTNNNGFIVDVLGGEATPRWLLHGFKVPDDWNWHRNQPTSLGQPMLPTFSANPAEDKRTGFIYRATRVPPGGKTGGMKEPDWPTKLGGTVPDGDVTWTCWAYEGGALYHEPGGGSSNFSTYNYIYVEGHQQPCRFEGETAIVNNATYMHPQSQAITAVELGKKVPFTVWSRRLEPWDNGYLTESGVQYPVIVSVGEPHGEPLGTKHKDDIHAYWAVATSKRADGYNNFGPGFTDGTAPDVKGRWEQDVGVLRDRWDGAYGRKTVGNLRDLPGPTLRWKVEWYFEGGRNRKGVFPFHSYTQVGGRSLPQPAAMCFPSVWLGNRTGVERRLGAVPALADGRPDLTGLDQSGGNAFEQGDILFNAPMAGRPNLPVAWRAKDRAAVPTQHDAVDHWQSGATYYAGYVLRDNSGGLWRAKDSGYSGANLDDRPPFEGHRTPGTVLQDRYVSWEFWCLENAPVWEPLITEIPVGLDVDVSDGGTRRLTSEQAAHREIRFTGAPQGDVEVIVEPGHGELWTKTFVNATTGDHGLRVRATDGGSGVWVHQGSAANLVTTGTDVESLSSPSRRGEQAVCVDTSTGSTTTSDEVPATVALCDLVDPDIKRVDLIVTVTDDTRTTRGTWSITALAARTGGTTSLDGSGQDANAIKTHPGLDAHVSASGASVQLECRGLANTPLTWGWELRAQRQSVLMSDDSTSTRAGAG
jgi:hypothetical protein